MISTVEKPKTTADIPNGMLTFEEIKDIVGDGWAIIRNPEFDGCIFLKGELVYYGYDKKDVYHRDRAAGENNLYFKYCGKRDPNIVYLL